MVVASIFHFLCLCILSIMHLILVLIILNCFSLINAAPDYFKGLWRPEYARDVHTTLAPRDNGAPLRNVYAVADIQIRPTVISPKSGNPLLYGHAFLHVEGSAQDGAIRVEHVQPRPDFQIGMRMLDYTVQNNDKADPGSQKRLKAQSERSILVGQTPLTNAEFADPTTGKGLILDVWSKDPHLDSRIELLQPICPESCQKAGD